MDDTHSSSKPDGREHRKLRNLLINRGMQLRFTFTVMFIILLMCISFGVSIYIQNQKTNAFFAEQRRKASQLFQKQIEESMSLLRSSRGQSTKDLAKVMRTATDMLDVQLKDKDPVVREMAALAKKTLQEDDQKRIQRRKKDDQLLFEKRQQAAQAQLSLQKKQEVALASLFQKQTMWIFVLLGLFCFLMLALVFIFSIRVTHRVAGPLFKMSRYFDAMRNGETLSLTGLRKNDLLKDFYDKFVLMYNAQKTDKAEKQDALKEILSLLEAEQADEAKEKVEQLCESHQKREARGVSEETD